MLTVKAGRLEPWPVLAHADSLLELDQLVTDLDAAIRARDDAARAVLILEHRIEAARLAAAGQAMMEFAR